MFKERRGEDKRGTGAEAGQREEIKREEVLSVQACVKGVMHSVDCLKEASGPKQGAAFCCPWKSTDTNHIITAAHTLAQSVTPVNCN